LVSKPLRASVLPSPHSPLSKQGVRGDREGLGVRAVIPTCALGKAEAGRDRTTPVSDSLP